MAETMYNAGKLKLLTSATAWDAGTFKVLGIGTLPTTATQLYNPDLANVAAILALTGIAEASGTGYSRLTLSSKTITEDDTNDRVALDAADLSYTSANGWTLRALIVYWEAATDTLRIPVMLFDSGLPITATGANLLYTFNSVGLLTAS